MCFSLKKMTYIRMNTFEELMISSRKNAGISGRVQSTNAKSCKFDTNVVLTKYVVTNENKTDRNIQFETQATRIIKCQ